jgi:hypothetical protein
MDPIMSILSFNDAVKMSFSFIIGHPIPQHDANFGAMNPRINENDANKNIVTNIGNFALSHS